LIGDMLFRMIFRICMIKKIPVLTKWATISNYGQIMQYIITYYTEVYS